MSASEPTALERFLNGILPENPIYRQLLGMCPTLAVTGAMKPAMTMVAATAFVLIAANVIISLIRGLLKPHLRILVFTLTIATFVTIADRFLAAYVYEMSKQLGSYIPLIIVNCIIISRCEICASKQSVGVALADAVGMSLGFGLALGSIATVREILGAGQWFGVTVLPPDVWPSWGIMALPPGAFLTLGLLLALVNWIGQRRAESLALREKQSKG
ncbi:MAG: electron transport complex subunit RsxE [Pirellulales bacterium]|nr:electron transport complex subunit RsxE [Pirellulales bacterium]